MRLSALSITPTLIEAHNALSQRDFRDWLKQYDGSQTLAPSVDVTLESINTARKLNQRNTVILLRGLPPYPAQLEALGDDAPDLLYAAGNLELLAVSGVAIIGTRNPSEEGIATASAVASIAAQQSKCVISGNAPGIDSVAHTAVLEAGGNTIVCPPTPMLQFQPKFPMPSDSTRILVLSPFAPNTKIEPWCFLRRNSLVAALAQAVFVAETGPRGGTLNTVRKAHRLRRSLAVAELPTNHTHYDAHRMLMQSYPHTFTLPLNPGASDFNQWANKIIISRHIAQPASEDIFQEEFL